MSKKICLMSCLVFIVASSHCLFAQKPFLDFDNNAAGWIVTLHDPVNNKVELSDNNTDFVQGTGSLEIRVEINNFPEPWGTWTDMKWDFRKPVNLKGKTDLCFLIKILEPTSVNRSLQFTLDLFDEPPGAGGKELWRWAEDLDIFYDKSQGSWYNIIIPLSRLHIPDWSPPVNGVFDAAYITTMALGVHGDATAPDDIRFLLDYMTATRPNRHRDMIDFDDNSGWVVTLHDPINNIMELTDNSTDFVEGEGSLQTRVVLNNFPEPWGTWTDAKYTFRKKLNLHGATELRFLMKIIDPPLRKNMLFTLDLVDRPKRAAFPELWRWPQEPAAPFGGAYGMWSKLEPTDGRWLEVVIPLSHFSIPGWSPTENGVLDLAHIESLHFGIHGDVVDAQVDDITVLFDDLRATTTPFKKLERTSKPATILTSGRTTSNEPAEEEAGVPAEYTLSQNYPNPFNPETEIFFQLPEASTTTLSWFSRFLFPASFTM